MSASNSLTEKHGDLTVIEAQEKNKSAEALEGGADQHERALLETPCLENRSAKDHDAVLARPDA